MKVVRLSQCQVCSKPLKPGQVICQACQELREQATGVRQAYDK